MSVNHATRALGFLVTWSVAGATLALAQDAERKRIAVLDFEYQTVHQYVYEIFGSDVDIGKGITTMLVTDLVREGTYSVIERQALDQVLREQNFQASGRADASTAAQLGKILGVDAVVIGSITQFGRDDQSVGAAGRVGVGPVRIGGFGRKKSKAVVGIDARIIDVQTAEILAVATGKGESSRSGTKLFGAGIGGIGAAGAIDMSSSNFGSTIIGEATREATEALLGEVVAADARIVHKVVAIQALVADVVGNEVTINAGSGEGVRAGVTYDVVRPGREIKDPATGKVLRRVTSPVGSLTITEAGDGYGIGNLDGGPAQVGDCVGSCPDPQQQSAEAPPPSNVAVNQSASRGGGGILSLPSGPWTWTPYKFKGTEHFKYDVSFSERGRAKTGYYVLDLQPAAGGKFRIRVDGKLGEDAYSSTVTAPSADGGMGMGLGMAQFMTLGPVGIALFSPAAWMLFMGREMTLGDGWSSSSGGESFSVKVEKACQHAGVEGLLTVMRENEEMRSQTCVSPSVALPLAVALHDGSDVTEMKLVEFSP